MLDETMEPVGPLKYRDNMELRRITAEEAGEGFHLLLALTNGTLIERDVGNPSRARM